MPRRVERVVVGRITAPHGLKGWVRVLPLTDFGDRFVKGATFLVGSPEKAFAERVVEDVLWRGNFLLLRFQGVFSRTEAEMLRGLFLAVSREDVPPLPPGHFYHFELIGLRVLERGIPRGTVDAVIPMSVYDYLVVRDVGGKEFFLPFVSAFVVGINLEEGFLEVECPEGFWE
ncbi:ribosome maturation factor RimM [Candidatus Caldatribacterium sp.]|uniref:ribosome maturation factor RimM n=1 Tax=Candidatus Caldatribacterium sp. TaxID=2282143 RepID=UPI002994FA76|nr:ribosome maturation factor RimM [Candidatus Caldatribacterium sp.]MDW8080518.1 ribosome maturation factor RimM [Candidatus Calescibacterium sp.]